MLQLRREGYTDVALVDLGPAGEFIFLMSAAAAQQVAVEKSEAFARRVTVPLFETLKLDRGIVYEQGSRHRRNKKLCIPSFESKSSMTSFYRGVHAEFDALHSRWEQLCNKSGGSAHIDLYAEMRKVTLDIILRVTFGLGDAATSYERADELSDTIKEYLERIVATANEIPPVYQFIPQLSSNYNAVVGRLLPKLRELVDDVIAERRRSISTELGAPTSRADLLSVLAADESLDDTEISQILFDIIIAGSDTTASTLSAALYVMHEPRHQDKSLKRACEEASGVDTEGVPLADLKTELPYITAVTRETLRLYPPVPFFGRTSVANATISDFFVKDGSTACFSPWYMGRDEFAWGSNAQLFVPERWIENPTGGAPTASQWLPFGAGLRGCLGTRLAVTEATVGLAHLLKDFSFNFDLKGELQFTYDITLNLEGSTTCTISRRQHTAD